MCADAPTIDGSRSSTRAALSTSRAADGVGPALAESPTSASPGPRRPARADRRSRRRASSSRRSSGRWKYGGREVGRVVAVSCDADRPGDRGHGWPRTVGRASARARGRPASKRSAKWPRRRRGRSSRSTRRASERAATRSARRVRWYSGPMTSTASADSSLVRQLTRIRNGECRHRPRGFRASLPRFVHQPAPTRRQGERHSPCRRATANTTPAAPPTSTIRAGGAGRWRDRISFVRSNSSSPGPVASRDSSWN